jgi:putative phage-type endonuclease
MNQFMEQNTDEWHNARLGKVTASRVFDVITKTRSGYSTNRAKYMAELLCERLTRRQGDFFKNAAMAWGTETEPYAREVYETDTGSLVIETGFVPHPTIPMSGASPDGLVGDDGLIEIKCPNTSTHLDTLASDEVPPKYMVQMQWQMACTGRKWCDFVSYDPRVPAEFRTFSCRVPRDEAMISNMETEVSKFLAELDAKIDGLKAKYGRDF